MREQSVFFTKIQYDEPYHISTKKNIHFTEKNEVLLVSGIANPKPLKKLLEDYSEVYYMMQYPDHYIFTIDDLKEIKKRFESIDGKNKIILTTEKDAVRLVKFNNVINELPLFVIPIRHRFLFDEERRFNQLIIDFIQNFKLSVNSNLPEQVLPVR